MTDLATAASPCGHVGKAGAGEAGVCVCAAGAAVVSQPGAAVPCHAGLALSGEGLGSRREGRGSGKSAAAQVATVSVPACVLSQSARRGGTWNDRCRQHGSYGRRLSTTGNGCVEQCLQFQLWAARPLGEANAGRTGRDAAPSRLRQSEGQDEHGRCRRTNQRVLGRKTLAFSAVGWPPLAGSWGPALCQCSTRSGAHLPDKCQGINA